MHKSKAILRIWITLLAACALMLLPMSAAYARPAWLVMVLAYWLIYRPEYAGIGVAFIAGLILDVLQNSLLGQNALALTTVACLLLRLQRRIRFYPLPQQSVLIFCVVVLYEFLWLWPGMLSEHQKLDWMAFIPALTSAFLWPWLFILLSSYSKHYCIHD